MFRFVACTGRWVSVSKGTCSMLGVDCVRCGDEGQLGSRHFFLFQLHPDACTVGSASWHTNDIIWGTLALPEGFCGTLLDLGPRHQRSCANLHQPSITKLEVPQSQMEVWDLGFEFVLPKSSNNSTDSADKVPANSQILESQMFILQQKAATKIFHMFFTRDLWPRNFDAAV